MRALKQAVLASLAVALSQSIAVAAVLSGRVQDPSGKPLSNVQVVIPALQRGAKTDESGAYKIENVPAGDYAVEFRPVSYPKVTKDANLAAGDAVLDVVVTGSPLTLAPITISAAPTPQSTLTTPASVSVIEGRQLDRARGQSVITSIQDEPGVNMISEGPTVVKPEIRGLNSQDIVVVEDGIRSEALQWGSEHAPEIDPLGTERIEVMRGPNSLLYGSDALGGVITITHPELPNANLGAGALSGKLVTDVESVNKSLAHGAQLAGAQGDWGWRTNLSQRQAGDWRNPQVGDVPNTGLQEVSGSGTLGVRKDWGGLTFDYGRFDKRVELQNPPAPVPAPLSDDEYQVLHHDKGSVKANFITEPVRVDLTLGYDRANRNEFDHQSDQDANGNLINNSQTTPHLHWIETSYTADAKGHLAPMGPFQGTVGVSSLRRIEQSIGDVHLTPGYGEDSVGEYLYEELPIGKFNFSFGVRGDQSHYAIGADDLIGIDPDNSINSPHPTTKESINYSALSGAVGGVYHVTEPLAVAVNVGRGYRNPVPFELFAYGVHEGAGVFQIGNPGLQPESSFNTDASVRWASERVKAEVGVFRNYIHNYIYGTYLGVIEPNTGLPEVQETQANATIQGTDFVVSAAAADWLTLKAGGNLVRGYNDNYKDASLPNHNIPHVPADNGRVGFEVHQKKLWEMENPYFGADVKGYRPQSKTGPEEIATPGYALVGLRTGTEFLVMNNRLTVDAGVDNLLNKGYIDFNSILKEFNIENPGRNVFMRVSVPFGS